MENQEVKAEEKVVGVDNTLPATTDNNPTALMPSTNDFQYIEKLAEQMVNLEKIGTMLVKGTLCAAKTVPDFIVATITGQQLGIPMMTAVNNIFNVNGKAGLATHIMRALILRAGVVYEKIADFEPVFTFYEGEPAPENPGKLRAKKVGEPKTPIIRGTGTIDELDTTKYVAGNKEIDRITKYKFERRVRQPDGTYKDMKVISYFSIVDAQRAELLDKDNYKKYPARMLDARAFAIGAREIASDVLFGMYTVAELADANDIAYEMSENFEEKFVDAEIVN